MAISDAGVLVVEQGDADDETETALELTNPKDHFDPIHEVEQNLPFHLYAVCSSGGGKGTYVGKLAERFKYIPERRAPPSFSARRSSQTPPSAMAAASTSPAAPI